MLNDNLADINNKLALKNFPAIDFHTPVAEGEYAVYGDNYLNPPYSGLVAGRLSVKANNPYDIWIEFRPWNSLDIYYLIYANTTWTGWRKISPSVY